jgi:hypothetical protein
VGSLGAAVGADRAAGVTIDCGRPAEPRGDSEREFAAALRAASAISA